MCPVVGSLPGQLLDWLVRNKVTGPYLAMWMGIRTSHHLALVLEDLYPAIMRRQVAELLDPKLNDCSEARPRVAPTTPKAAVSHREVRKVRLVLDLPEGHQA